MTHELEKTGKTVNEAVKSALLELGVNEEQVEIEVLDEPVKGIFGLLSKPARVRVKVKQDPADKAFRFLSQIINAIKVNVNIDIEQQDDNIYIDLQGSGLGLLIGKRGQTLDALQYLVSLVANKNTDKYIRVIIDAAGYRKRREDTLETLAGRLAKRVKTTGKSVALEPMPPYERRIIHTALQTDSSINTYSEGEEPFRKVIISLKS